MAKTTSRTCFADLVHWALLPSAMCTGNLASWWKYNCKLKQHDEKRGMIERGAQRGFIESSARTDRLHSDSHNPAIVSSSLYWIHLSGLDESNMAVFVHIKLLPGCKFISLTSAASKLTFENILDVCSVHYSLSVAIIWLDTYAGV